MKKIFIFLFLAGLVTTAMAQDRQAQHRNQNNSYRSNEQSYRYNNDRNHSGRYDRNDDRRFNNDHRGFDRRYVYDRYHRTPNRAWLKIRFGKRW